MKGNKSIGGQWNYDAENWKPPKEGLTIAPPYIGEPYLSFPSVLTIILIDVEPFYFAVTCADALQFLDQFIEQR